MPSRRPQLPAPVRRAARPVFGRSGQRRRRPPSWCAFRRGRDARAIASRKSTYNDRRFRALGQRAGKHQHYGARPRPGAHHHVLVVESQTAASANGSGVRPALAAVRDRRSSMAQATVPASRPIRQAPASTQARARSRPTRSAPGERNQDVPLDTVGTPREADDGAKTREGPASSGGTSSCFDGSSASGRESISASLVAAGVTVRPTRDEQHANGGLSHTQRNAEHPALQRHTLLRACKAGRMLISAAGLSAEQLSKWCAGPTTIGAQKPALSTIRQE